MSIILYTQPKCPYCDILKEMLDTTGFTYYTINIREDVTALKFMKTQGHTTVPQLYVDDNHVNKKNTQDYTQQELYESITKAMDNWPWQDSGIEQGI
jgi:glutaredoxin